ncbi:YbbR-like domain-containing protein [Marinilabiliaceae bacterium ANBcel2]|nr:YbbR-like domain-containing protein [Marinilabiliaceae bacterium ANBcel2]
MHDFKEKLKKSWIRVSDSSLIAFFKRLKNNRDFIVFLLFFLISSAFWFLNALRDNYTTTFSYPVRYVNTPEEDIITESSVDRVTMEVSATGYTLVRQYLSNPFIPVSIDVSAMNRMVRNNREYAYITTSEQEELVKEQLLLGIELLSIVPDTIFLNVEEKHQETFPVKLKGDIKFETQHAVAGDITINPDSVLVLGPRSLIETLSAVYARYTYDQPLRTPYEGTLAIIKDERLQYIVEKVDVNIPVEPFSEHSYSIPIEVLNLPDSLRIKTFPPNAEVTFRAVISRFENISENDFRLIVDGSTVLREDRPNRLRVEIKETPENIRSVDIVPLFVEYLIERKRSVELLEE